MEPRVTGREIVIAENTRMQVRIYELQQRIIALNTDRNELICENTLLRNRNEELVTKKNQFETDNIQIHEKEHYKAANIKEFEDFISNYIFGLFNNIGTLFRFDNQNI
ncbi:21913_t:CDS:2, partial [Racocetra persica]